MKFVQALAPVAALFPIVSAWGETGTYWTTVVTTAYTTYCPSPTTFVLSNVTYTATQETTLTITNCPCTLSVSQPAPITTTEYCTEETSHIGTGTGTGAPGPSPTGTTTKVYPTYGNSSTVITYTPPPTTYISGTIPITSSHPTTLVTGTVPLSSNVPTKTPVGPTTSHPVTVPTAAAARVGPVGVILAAGLAVMAL
ncbi:hypothetical protein SCUP234_12103 [Seiridium cupressi]